MDTLREYIFDDVANDEGNLRDAEANENWPHVKGKLVNWQYGREATKEEKAAVTAKVDLEVRAMQQALESVGEKPLTPAEVKHIKQVKQGYYLFAGDLHQMLGTHKCRQEKLKKHPCPNLYRKALVDSFASDLLLSFRDCQARRAAVRGKLAKAAKNR